MENPWTRLAIKLEIRCSSTLKRDFERRLRLIPKCLVKREVCGLRLRYVLRAESIELVGRSIGESHASFATDSLASKSAARSFAFTLTSSPKTPVHAFWVVALGVGWDVACGGSCASAVTDATVAWCGGG